MIFELIDTLCKPILNIEEHPPLINLQSSTDLHSSQATVTVQWKKKESVFCWWITHHVDEACRGQFACLWFFTDTFIRASSFSLGQKMSLWRYSFTIESSCFFCRSTGLDKMRVSWCVVSYRAPARGLYALSHGARWSPLIFLNDAASVSVSLRAAAARRGLLWLTSRGDKQSSLRHRRRDNNINTNEGQRESQQTNRDMKLKQQTKILFHLLSFYCFNFTLLWPERHLEKFKVCAITHFFLKHFIPQYYWCCGISGPDLQKSESCGMSEFWERAQSACFLWSRRPLSSHLRVCSNTGAHS